ARADSDTRDPTVLGSKKGFAPPPRRLPRPDPRSLGRRRRPRNAGADHPGRLDVAPDPGASRLPARRRGAHAARRLCEHRAVSLADFERIPLTFGPSPVHRLERLGEHLGGEVEIWAKRDDCNSGLAYGGNKVRKLEYLVADALASRCDTLGSH